ncbi:scavenger receptor class B member 1 isoform X2 [Leptinotarsa decemlineata]|uniref:scavenger receptor class B member 1 isoform X2 n=1 Tax=Leptinotarsa decemlineata TaxID=7539 RepID=UPI003D305CBA
MILLKRLVIICSAIVDTAVKGMERLITLKGSIAIAILGIAGILIGTAINIVDPYDIIFRWKLIFEEGGEIFELWRKPPVELYLKVYLWNVTNKEEYMSGEHDKLRVQEVGPYVYRELMAHENVTFNKNGTLTAVPKHPLEWVEELSMGRKEDDLLILPNIALLSIADVVSESSYFTKMGLNIVVRQTESEPLVQMTAKEFMFGYSSTLMTLGNSFMPSWIYFEKLGLIDRMYDFEGDYETVYNGQKLGLKNIGLIEKYRGSTKIPQWDSPCGDIMGASDGTKFPGYIEPNDTLLFFRKSMCRAKSLVKVNETISNGLKAYVYHFDSEADDNGWVHERNKCFCKREGKCLPKGLLDVRECYYGFPIALSYPHFLDGDKVLTAKVNGTDPERKKHESYFIIQPESGLPIELSVRYQINMALGDIKAIANCDKFDNMVLPLLWTDIKMDKLPDNLSTRFRLYLNVLPLMEEYLVYALFIGGAIFIIVSIYKIFQLRHSDFSFEDPWIEDEIVHNIDRKLSSYIPEKRRSLADKEIEVYIENMIPLKTENQKYV